ncbi:Zonadhesin [Eumeta japonica]|uniref:Zonadhesin n=1 Tax=Eumeta variegata TaxID=151549 RepID=A0A4C1WUG8_EUMVA|nr:Zonadhesin [Eumeta japonica]
MFIYKAKPEGCGGDPNAEKTGCGTYCGHSCSDYNKTHVACPRNCNPDGCSCKKGYVYDPNVKKCVLPDKCTLQCTGPNEEYKVCAPTCPPETCDTSDAKFKCVPPPKPGDPKCKEGCRCKSGYYRDYRNICVKKSDCSKCTKSNQIYDSCWSSCPPGTCDSIGKQYECPEQPVPGDSKCVGKCRCRKGYYTNSKGECVSESECEKCESESGSDESEDCEDGGTKEPKCPKNEVYSTCIQGQCGPKNCTQLGKSVACRKIDPKYCKKGCICAEGYLRDEHGKCIPKDKCPKPEGCGGDPNAEKTGCGTYCGHSCSDYNKTGVICPAVCNPDGCSCKKGYVYDPNVKKCVLPKKCTLQCTGANEEYNACAPTCPPQTCDTIGLKFSCLEQPAPGDPKCKEGCRCKSGYYRDYLNVCVKKSYCSKCTKPNQIYDSCWYNCPPDTCDSIGKSYSCPAQVVPGDPKCVGKCRCKKGYYTNSKGECISESECEKCESTTESGSQESEEGEDTESKER